MLYLLQSVSSLEYGFSTSIFFISFTLFVTGAISALCNLFLIYVTVKHRSLRCTYNILLALLTLCDALHCSSYGFSFYFSLVGHNLLGLIPCFYIQAYAVPAWTMSIALQLIIAVDRLLAISLPTWHQLLKKSTYVTVLCLPGIAFSAWIFVESYTFAIQRPAR
ncbi:CBN-SRSX-25 protein, partial [Aphelenchoides avenae]